MGLMQLLVDKCQVQLTATILSLKAMSIMSANLFIHYKNEHVCKCKFQTEISLPILFFFYEAKYIPRIKALVGRCNTASHRMPLIV